MRIGLFNTNPAWGGGERWFLEAGAALRARGHQVVSIGRVGTPLFRRWGQRATPEAALDALCAGDAPLELLLCNSGREVRCALRSMSRDSPTRLILRRGLDRVLRDNWLRRRSWRRLSAILVNSDATAATVRRSLPWFPPDRIRRIYNPVPLPAPTAPPAFDAPIRLAVVGRLVDQKGFDLLLDALGEAGASFDWTLAVAGEGRRRGALERQARRLGLAGRVRFLGHLDRVEPLYAEADLVVVPSRYEGFCFVAVEAALAGRPVVGTRVSSLPEVVEDGATGLLVPPGDPAALLEAIRALVTDPTRARAMGARGSERARERFAPERIHAELESFLMEVAAAPPP